ncbi:RagB/SusD family nutrient uptake outer membrane protein [Flavobacteriaceae bacterium]|nr:RagB/SusD family nutrient uptake outer membrane protein [Flavobacteriaceae bacterium]MDA9029977.1 RagB/SusD family nutrient uptake outer membrane protein [Flavobacteriaceae bacterium]
MKKNKNIITAILVFTLVATGIYSCSDEYLDETDNYNIDSQGYFNSEDDYYMALVGVYDLLQASYVNVLLGEIASDNTLCGGESATDVVGFQQIDDMGHTSVNSNLRDVWSWMFSGISRANYFLEFQDKTDFDGRNKMIAEVRFLRAYYHFELVKWFGGVPIKDYDAALLGSGKRFAPGDELSIPRYSAQEVYALIESDLIFAVNNLEYTAPQVGRVTKGAAEALLGKAYLYQDKFSDAATVLDNVINNGPYQLASSYETMFENEGENNVESVFEVQYTDAEGAGFGCLQCSEGNVAVGFNSIRNHTGPTYDSGYSFNVPTQEAVDSFEDGDSRKEVSVLDIEAWAEQTGATYGIGYEHTGYYNRKYIARQGDQNIGDQNLTNPNNYRSIRFADVLLMAAEANNRGSIDDAKAQSYLNMVRTRAFGGDSNNVSASGSELTDAIYYERRVELVGEGHRFFDLVRTGQAASEIEGFQVGKHELFPIPVQEIQFSNGNWNQNPNY